MRRVIARIVDIRKIRNIARQTLKDNETQFYADQESFDVFLPFLAWNFLKGGWLASKLLKLKNKHCGSQILATVHLAEMHIEA